MWASPIYGWLVVWLPFLVFSHILGIIIPIDFHIFQRGSNHQPDGNSPMKPIIDFPKSALKLREAPPEASAKGGAEERGNVRAEAGWPRMAAWKTQI